MMKKQVSEMGVGKLGWSKGKAKTQNASLKPSQFARGESEIWL